MRLYELPWTPWCQSVRALFSEKGLPYERHVLLPGQELEGWFLELNPSGRVPLLVSDHDDAIVREGPVILEYLEEVHPQRPLMPVSPEERALVRTLMHLADQDLGAPLEELYLIREESPSEDPSLEEELEEEVVSGLALLADILDPARPYAAGEAFTLADLALAPLLIELPERAGFEGLIEEFEEVAHYRDRLVGRPGLAVIRQSWGEWDEWTAASPGVEVVSGS